MRTDNTRRTPDLRTNCYLTCLSCSVVLLIGWVAIETNAQTSSVQAHAAKAKAVAYEPGYDFTVLYDFMCGPALAAAQAPQGAVQAPAPPGIPPRSYWYTEPAKVFDNLYFIGTQRDSIWAVTTSDGIIVIDTAHEYSIQEASSGLKKFGLDPAQIKFVVLSHGHEDRYAGARYLQQTYHSRVVMTEADWNIVAKNVMPADHKPTKDMVATDGMNLTLGDTRLTLYVTPGHTPGAVMTLVPLRDGSQRHVGMVWGGNAPRPEGDGVRYFASELDSLKTYTATIKRGREIATKAGADVFLSIHPWQDRGLDKINAVGFRKTGDPHPLVSRKSVERFLTVMAECTAARLAKVSGE